MGLIFHRIHTKHCVCLCVFVNSQEDACSQKQEERVFHQIGVGPRQHGEVRVVFFQVFDPALPSLEHSFEPAEGAARQGGCDAADGK